MRHNGHKSKGRVSCPGCGRYVSHNLLQTIARHNVQKGQRAPENDQRCAASLRGASDKPSRYVVCCGHCGGPPWAPEDWCDDAMHGRPPVRVA